jgi:hypothetical protein
MDHADSAKTAMSAQRPSVQAKKAELKDAKTSEIGTAFLGVFHMFGGRQRRLAPLIPKVAAGNKSLPQSKTPGLLCAPWFNRL